MEYESIQATEADRKADEIVEIDAAELELREDMTYFVCPIPKFPLLSSDRRLKIEIEDAGTLANGLKLHSWRYLGGSHRFTGFMADELLANPAYAHAVHADADGLMRVDYGATGYLPADIEAMRSEGQAAMDLYRERLN